jgi:hypothetical protein
MNLPITIERRYMKSFVSYTAEFTKRYFTFSRNFKFYDWVLCILPTKRLHALRITIRKLAAFLEERRKSSRKSKYMLLDYLKCTKLI